MEFPDPFESEDAEEELILQSAMEDLMLDGNEISIDENDETIEPVSPETTIDVAAVPEKRKNKKQSQITDFFTAK